MTTSSLTLRSLVLALLVGLTACITPAEPKPKPLPTNTGSGSSASASTTTGGSGASKQPAAAQPAANTSGGSGAMVQTGGMNRASLAYPTGDVGTSAVLIEKFAPVEVNAGAATEYVIRVTNLTSLTLDDVVVTDDVGDNFTISGTTPPSVGSGKNLRWALGSMAPRAVLDIRVAGAAGGPGTFGSCAEVTYASSLCVTTRVVEPMLEITKQAPDSVLACEAIPVRIVVTNRGTGAANNVTITDDLPSGMTTTDGRSSITVDVGTLPAGQARELTLNLQTTGSGRYTNTATATADGGLRATSNSTTTIVTKPQLAITKDGPTRQFVGRNFTYDVSVTNRGDGIARDTILQDAIPAGTRFVSASTGGQLSGDRVVWGLGNLAPGESRQVTVMVQGVSKGIVRNIAQAQAYCAEPVTAQVETSIEGIPAILLEVVDLEDPIEVGSNETYEIRVTNQGSATDTNIRISCGFDNGMQFVTTSGPTSGTSTGSGVTFAPLAALGPGEQAVWRIVVKATSQGDMRFAVRMESDQLTRPVDETEATNFYE